ncbi:MAG TPA: hypothetical protein VGO27_00375 [Candidatus Acidoferrum sp.]|jgi:hypothetical protein|nr:hypothetical protein [Candidatus Acidoferrum sp.]
MVKHAHPYLVESGIEVLAPMIFAMPMSILVTDDELGFITSVKLTERIAKFRAKEAVQRQKSRLGTS